MEGRGGTRADTMLKDLGECEPDWVMINRAPSAHHQMAARLQYPLHLKEPGALIGEEWSPCWQNTTSNDWSGKGMLKALLSHHSIALSSAADAERATASIPAVEIESNDPSPRSDVVRRAARDDACPTRNVQDAGALPQHRQLHQISCPRPEGRRNACPSREFGGIAGELPLLPKARFRIGLFSLTVWKAVRQGAPPGQGFFLLFRLSSTNEPCLTAMVSTSLLAA